MQDCTASVIGCSAWAARVRPPSNLFGLFSLHSAAYPDDVSNLRDADKPVLGAPAPFNRPLKISRLCVTKDSAVERITGHQLVDPGRQLQVQQARVGSGKRFSEPRVAQGDGAVERRLASGVVAAIGDEEKAKPLELQLSFLNH